MPTITSNHKDLFRIPDTDDKLNLFRVVLNDNELTVTLSLALLKIIHGELKSNDYSDRLVYKRYAESIEFLRYHMLDTLQLVVVGVIMSLWGGFKRRVHGVLAGWIISSIFFSVVGVGTWLPLWVAAMALTSLFGPLIAGLMGDYVLGPAMRIPRGILPSLFGWVTPPGPGAGMGLLVFLSCFGGVIAGVAGYLSPHTRNAETILPDHDQPLQLETE